MKRGNNTQEIQEQFTQLMTVEDVVALINLAKSDIFGESCEPITIKQFNYHRYNSLNKKRYSSFSIKKKSGGERIIYAPNSGLKAIQTCLNYIFQLCFSPSNSSYGFVEGRSVVDNARQHIGQNFVFNIDLKDFFPSIEAGRIFKRLQVKPFNLSHEAASAITDICCHKMTVERINIDGRFVKTTRSVLPQGAPTSPIFTNIICEKLDRKLLKLATNFNLKYTRYADDITFSGYYNAFEDSSDFIQNMKRIIAEEGFFINEKKTRLQKHNVRQEVTGLVVSNDRVNVSKKYIKDLRGILFCWEKYGEAEVLKHFTPRYKEEKGHIKKGEPDIKNVVSGKLLYLRMVKGADNNTYQKLQSRFDKLCGINPNPKLVKILNIWEQNGIDAAMKKYYKNDSDKEAAFSAMEYKKFISEILNKQGIDNQNTDQIVNLLVGKKELRQISKEVMFEACKKLWEENESLKKNNKKHTIPNKRKSSQERIHNPKLTADFLSLFNRREGLKYLTHNYDNSGMTLKEMMSQVKSVFKIYENSENLPRSLRALMSRFINGGEWTDFEGKKCSEGYSSDNWIEWSEQNDNMHPIMDIGGIESIIQRFRHTTRIVAPDLLNIIELITKKFPALEFNYNAQNLGKADFYTNVYILRLRMLELIKDMADHVDHKNIKIEYKPGFNEDYFIRQIIITQIGSFSQQPIDDVVEKFKSEGGFFSETADILTGYCNWSVESLWDGKPFRWNILKEENDKEIEQTEKENINGFSHILTFYYKA